MATFEEWLESIDESVPPTLETFDEWCRAAWHARDAEIEAAHAETAAMLEKAAKRAKLEGEEWTRVHKLERNLAARDACENIEAGILGLIPTDYAAALKEATVTPYTRGYLAGIGSATAILAERLAQLRANEKEPRSHE